MDFITKKNYWKNRKCDWEKAYFADHSHRDLLIEVLENIPFNSIIEVGCASGYNLHKIRKHFPKVEIGGIDINEDAIETAKELLPENTAVLEQSPATKMFLQDKSVDIVLCDAILLYINPFEIDKVIKEIKRISRGHILFIELHSNSWWERWKVRLFDGYNLYNYRKLLEKHDFYNIEILKMSKNDWSGSPWEDYGHVISARL